MYDKLCDYGCGKTAIKLTGTGKYICANSHNSCPEIKRLKETKYLEKYGVTCPSKAEIVKQKTEKTNIERYGSKYVVTSTDFKEKSKKTLLENYGVDNPSKSDTILDRKKNTSLERYGVDHWSKLDSVKQKKKDTYRQNYGFDHYFQSETFKNHLKTVLMERYGADNPAKIEQFREKMIETCITRYGINRCKQISNGETNWLDKHNITCRQVKIIGKSGNVYYVDGFENNTVYEYLGIFWHGHPKYFHYEDENKVIGKNFGQLFEETKTRLNDIKNAGYEIIAIWETGELYTGEEYELIGK